MIYLVILSNANGISGRVANKLHIHLLFNETPGFVFVSHVCQCLELNVLLRAVDESSNLNQSGTTIFCFYTIFWKKIVFAYARSSESTYNSERIFLVLGNFYRVRIARSTNFRNTQDCRKLKVHFHCWSCFEVHEYHLCNVILNIFIIFYSRREKGLINAKT